MRAAVRLGAAPVLLLGWSIAAGDPLPFLGPSLLVLLLTGSPGRPSPPRLAAALAFVVGLSWVLARLFVAVGHSAIVVWLLLLALAVAGFARLARRAGDMLAMLTLMVASLVVVLRQWAADLGQAVPWLLGHAMTQAVIVVLIAHAVLPSPVADAAPIRAMRPRGEATAVLGRAAALIGLLVVATRLEDNSSVLVALTAIAILAAPVEGAAHAQGRALGLANLTAAALTLPLLAVAALRPDPMPLLLLALAGGILLASGIAKSGVWPVIARAGMPVYVVLLGTLLPKAGDTALSLLVDRLLTLGLVILYVFAALALFRTRTVRPVGAGPSAA